MRKNKFKSMKKITALLLAANVMTATMTGCSAKTEETAAATTAAAITEAATTAQQAEESQIITFTDAAGREITLDRPAENIVSGYYITTSMLIALGLKDKVVGIEAKADKRPIYGLAAPDFLELPNVGTAKEFDLEGCAALEPDLVILPKKLAEQADILDGLGITAMVVNPESTEELEETIKNIAAAGGTEDRAEEIFTYYAEQTAKLEKIAADSKAAGEAVPKVYIAGTADVLRTAGSSMYQNKLIELAGGENAAAELTDKGWTNIAYETLLKYDPDMLVIIPEAEYTKEDVLADEQLKDLKAVKNGEVYEMPSSFEAWDSPVTSGILGCMWLSSIMNEDVYSFEAFKEDAIGFYQKFYGVEIDSALITK